MLFKIAIICLCGRIIVWSNADISSVISAWAQFFIILTSHERQCVSNHQPITWLFVQRIVLVNTKWNVKAHYYWPFDRGIHRSPLDSPHKGPVMHKAPPWHDVIMYSSHIDVLNNIFQTPVMSSQFRGGGGGGGLGQVSYGGVQLRGPNPYPILGKAGLRKENIPYFREISQSRAPKWSGLQKHTLF